MHHQHVTSLATKIKVLAVKKMLARGRNNNAGVNVKIWGVQHVAGLNPEELRDVTSSCLDVLS